ncbi:DUF4097 family beta strand repeat-containing protein [Clostridium paraputrificum]|uniref:DUF4097 family beta strand repeat-containing protein n=1 Tax=Clostridium paraputrificum TaxID=29363 RepID=UPI003D34CAEB
MKKFISTKMKIFMALLASISIGCYIAAAIVLYNSDFKLANYIDEIDGHFNRMDNGFNMHMGWRDWNDSNSFGTIEKDFPTSIENLNVNSSSADIDIQFYEGSTIKVDISGNFYSNYSYEDGLRSFDISNNLVTIDTNEGNRCSSLNVKIYIPSIYKGNVNLTTQSGDLNIIGGDLAKINLSTHSGDIDISNLISQDLTINATSADIYASNTNSTKSNIMTSSGDIDIIGSLGDTKVGSSSGEVSLSLNSLGKTSNFSSTSGTIYLNIDKTIGYNLSFSTSSGELNGFGSNRNSGNRNNHTITNGDGSNAITVSTTSGDLEINN